MTMAASPFTVCALLYGDFPHLTRRCLKSLVPLLHSGVEVRLGLNDVSDASLEEVAKLFKIPRGGYGPGALYAELLGGQLKIYSAYPQIFKYPMMRRMFYEQPLATELVMWFDDDSYISDPNPVAWLDGVSAFHAAHKATMLGSIYHIGLKPEQRLWIATQPWYKGKSTSLAAKFITGGWWVLKTDVICQYNWPLVELKHCGGDVMLGQLLLENDLKLTHFRNGVAINADEYGKESESERRGCKDLPIGTNFKPR